MSVEPEAWCTDDSLTIYPCTGQGVQTGPGVPLAEWCETNDHPLCGDPVTANPIPATPTDEPPYYQPTVGKLPATGAADLVPVAGGLLLAGVLCVVAGLRHTPLRRSRA